MDTDFEYAVQTRARNLVQDKFILENSIDASWGFRRAKEANLTGEDTAFDFALIMSRTTWRQSHHHIRAAATLTKGSFPNDHRCCRPDGDVARGRKSRSSENVRNS